MRPSSSAALLGFFVIGACACGPIEITLQLRAGINSANERTDTSSVETLRVVLADEDGEQNNLEMKVDRDSQRAMPDIEVHKGKPFSIDVWGCASTAGCAEAERSFRGCQLVDLTEQPYRSKHPIPIDLVEAEDPLVAGCPPKTAFD